MDDPDAELIARVLASDDRGAFATLVNRHQAALRAFLRRVCAGNQTHADDLAQDAFVRAWGALPGFRGGSRFSTWLHRIAFNLYLSDRNRFASRASRDELPAAEGVDLDEGERAVTRRQLERAMGQLSIPERAAVSLMYGQGATQEEIAELLDCPVGTVKTHLARGKQKLRALLSAGAETAAAKPAEDGRP